MSKASFYQNVYDVTSLIPKGRVSTYGAIADYLSLGSARMVGWALNNLDKYDQEVPAHRVVNRKGELSGRNQFAIPGSMEERLVAEGVEIKAFKVVNFDHLFWHPRELDDTL